MIIVIYYFNLALVPTGMLWTTAPSELGAWGLLMGREEWVWVQAELGGSAGKEGVSVHPSTVVWSQRAGRAGTGPAWPLGACRGTTAEGAPCAHAARRSGCRSRLEADATPHA